MDAITLPAVKPAPEICSLPVLWCGFMRDPFRTVRVLHDDGTKLTVVIDDNEILVGVDHDAVIRHGSWKDPENEERVPRCGDCGHFFDPSDPRAFIPRRVDKYPELRPVCPACNLMQDGAKAWALWNGCQGVFADAVFHTREEAIVAVAGDTECFEAVVPVRVIVEPEDDHRARVDLTKVRKGEPQ